MKLELKDLAAYLPYDLNIWHYQWQCTLTMDIDGGYPYSFSIMDVMEGIGESKPLMRPLSDLTNEIEYNGEKYIGRYEFSDNEWAMFYKEGFHITDVLDYSSIVELIKRHFDVFGLIHHGLAIDINTVNK